MRLQPDFITMHVCEDVEVVDVCEVLRIHRRMPIVFAASPASASRRLALAT